MTARGIYTLGTDNDLEFHFPRPRLGSPDSHAQPNSFSCTLAIAGDRLGMTYLNDGRTKTYQRMQPADEEDMSRLIEKRFVKLLRSASAADGRELENIFYSWIWEGEPASRYTRLLATGRKRLVAEEDGAPVIVYTWKWRQGRGAKEGDKTIEVTAGGYHNMILRVVVSTDWSN